MKGKLAWDSDSVDVSMKRRVCVCEACRRQWSHPIHSTLIGHVDLMILQNRCRLLVNIEEYKLWERTQSPFSSVRVYIWALGEAAE